jgi:hypothetical protein
MSTDDLRRLHQTIGLALEMIDADEAFVMTEEEQENYRRECGSADMRIGDFLITKISGDSKNSPYPT